MVRLINKNNINQVADLAYSILHIQEYFTSIAQMNNPEISPCIYAMWHHDQFCVYGNQNKGNLNILISNSLDGEIVSNVAHKMGFKTSRGSSKRKGAVSGTLNLISKLKSGEDIAIMVDGPQGPLHEVKPGVILLAREAGVPIVPVGWYSDNLTFVTFPSWDKMTTPIGPCRLLNLYGEPIYVDNLSNEEAASKLKNALLEIGRVIPEKYKEAKKLKLWSKRK